MLSSLWSSSLTCLNITNALPSTMIRALATFNTVFGAVHSNMGLTSSHPPFILLSWCATAVFHIFLCELWFLVVTSERLHFQDSSSLTKIPGRTQITGWYKWRNFHVLVAFLFPSKWLFLYYFYIFLQVESLFQASSSKLFLLRKRSVVDLNNSFDCKNHIIPSVCRIASVCKSPMHLPR